MRPEEACAAVHRALSDLPVFSLPKWLPFKDGLYLFYERGEASGHGPDGRIVRIGNHPRSDGRLEQRLRMHYSGNKNGSVFRTLLGGALIRKQDPSSSCFVHWEKHMAKSCSLCRPIEADVSALLRKQFSFRLVAIPERADRNTMEALLVATIAACRICQPSPAWLGRYAYSAKVRASGLWNSEFVGGEPIGETALERFQAMAAASA